MRIFTAIFILLIVPATCFGVTNATRAVDAVPAYNACNGVFVENLTPAGSYSVTVVAGNVVLTQPYLLEPNGCYSVAIVAGPVTLSGQITNATLPVDAAPASDACDGAFVESIAPTGVYSVTVTASGVVLETSTFGPQGVVSITVVPNIGEVYWHDVAWNNVDWNHELVLIPDGNVLPIIIINMQ